MARRRGTVIDLTGIEPGAFPVVPEDDYNVVLKEAYFYTSSGGFDSLAFILGIEDNDTWEDQNLFLNHALTEKSRPFIMATLMALGIVEEADRGSDGKGRVVVDFEVEKGKNFRNQEVDMLTSFVINDELRAIKNRRAIATVTHTAQEVTDDSGRVRTVTRANVSKLEGFHESDTSAPRGRGKRKFGR